MPNTPGRYGALGRFSMVGEDLRNQVLTRFLRGEGVTNIRRGVRGDGYRVSNQAITELVKEIRTIQSREGAVNRVRGGRTPGRGAVTKVNQVFGRRYRYLGTAYLYQRRPGETVRSLRWMREHEADLSIVQKGIDFQDDALLTGRLIRDRAHDIIRKIDPHVVIATEGEDPYRPGQQTEVYDLVLIRLEVNAVLESS